VVGFFVFNMEKICGIYKITSPSGKIYIGESVNVFRRKYLYSTYKCIGQKKLYSSLKKYGWNLHIFEVIEECKFDELLCRERYWQDFYDSMEKGLNCKLTQCGDKKQKHSEETLYKMSGENNSQWGKKRLDNIIRNKENPLKGENHPMFGKKGELSANYGNFWTNSQKEKQSKLLKDLYKNKNGSRSKIILSLNTGIFYNTVKECAEVFGMNINTLRSRLNGNLKNNTELVYV
jgi:group I intron endonuclease